MARFTLGLVTGAAIMLIGGAAAGIHAQNDVTEAAAAAGVDVQDLAGAVNSQPGVDVWQYLRWEGKLAPLPQAPAEPPPGVWDRLAACESSGNWASTSNPKYRGGLQMDSIFWARYGGLAFAPAPHLASRSQQITVAIRGQAVQGWQAWPTCSRLIGLR